MIVIKYVNFNIDFKLGIFYMEYFFNMCIIVCIFDEMCNQLNKVLGICVFDCVEGYYNVCMYVVFYMFSKKC